MPDAASMLTPAMQATIGRSGDAVTVEIVPELVRRLAESLPQEDPALQAAITSDDPHAVVPAYALLTTNPRVSLLDVPDVPPYGLMAAEAWEILAPLRLGDHLTVVPSVVEIQERLGERVGHSLFVHHAMIYTNQRGEAVARLRRTMAYYPPRPRDSHRTEDR